MTSMRTMTPSAVTALLLVALASAEGPKTDATSKALLEAWAKKEYHLGTAGVQKATFEWKASGGFFGEGGGSGFSAGIEMSGWLQHTWTHGKDARVWGILQLVAMFAKVERPLKLTTALMYGPNDLNALRAALKGATLTARKEGESTLVVVARKAASPLRSLIFDKAGTLERIEVSLKDSAGAERRATLKLAYRKQGANLLATGWSFEVADPKQGQFTETAKIQYKEVQGVFVLDKVECVSKLVREPKPGEKETKGQKLSLKFRNWKLDVGTK